MSDEGEIRASSDTMLQMLERLQAVELEKRAVPLGSDEFVAYAAEAERLSRVIFRWSGIQQQMADETVTAVDRGQIERVAISEVHAEPVDRILARWREAQLRLEIARPGSPDAQAAASDVERLREEYQAAVESRAAGGPVDTSADATVGTLRHPPSGEAGDGR